MAAVTVRISQETELENIRLYLNSNSSALDIGNYASRELCTEDDGGSDWNKSDDKSSRLGSRETSHNSTGTRRTTGRGRGERFKG